MYGVRESWNDERLDDFAKHVDQRFDAVDQRFDKVDREMGRINDRLDGLHRQTTVANRIGLPRDRHAEVENAVALALYRRYEPLERRAENMLAPEQLHVWGTRRGGEIDFVCGPRTRIDAVEVADWTVLDRRKATAPMRALPGQPSLVASRDELDFGKAANVVPAAMLLWALSG